MSGYYNPYTDSHSAEDDLKDHPECKQKILAILRRVQEQLNHDEVRRLCEAWGCRNPGEFWSVLNAMSDEELRRNVDKVRKKRTPSTTVAELEVIYA